MTSICLGHVCRQVNSSHQKHIHNGGVWADHHDRGLRCGGGATTNFDPVEAHAKQEDAGQPTSDGVHHEPGQIT